MTQPDFDAHANNYDTVLDRSIEFSGEDSAYFAEYKIRDLRYEFDRLPKRNQDLVRVLDFGCGVGGSIPYLRQYFPGGTLLGVDVSTESLTFARQRHGVLADFLPMHEQVLPGEASDLDAAYAMCVFHHIDEQAHVTLLAKLRDRMKPGGMLMIYEHNPLNPLTVRVVNNCPFDVNAKLIPAWTLVARCKAAGYRDVRVRYRVFFPGFLRMFRFAERWLTWLPLGGQYYVRCLA